MREGLDIRSMYASICSIAAMHLGEMDRIRAILQVTHEYFSKIGGHSITAYEFNKFTDSLELIAMPGAPEREYMRGSTDNKLIFTWDIQDDVGIWMENDQDYEKYINHLAQYNGSDSIQLKSNGRSFRTRAKVPLATAKILLIRGFGQTNQKVGQIFFNFYAKNDNIPRFTPILRNAINFISCLVREILIARIYPLSQVENTCSTEQISRDLNKIFDQHRSNHVTSDQVRSLENEIAQIIRDASLKVTDNGGGYSELVMLFGDRLAMIYSGNTGSVNEPKPAILDKDSITFQCAKDQITYNNGDVNSDIANNEINLTLCKSLMIVPIRHGGDVRGLIRIGSRRLGAFNDSHCRGIMLLERIARSAIVFLDERKQKAQVSRALDFYMPDFTGNKVENIPAHTMSGVLLALGAEWGTYWPIDVVMKGGYGEKYKPPEADNILEPIHSTDSQAGFRTINSGALGFTSGLLAIDKHLQNGAFIALHIIPSDQRKPNKDNYYLQLFNPGTATKLSSYSDHEYIDLNDGFLQFTSTNTEPLTGFEQFELNKNTKEHPHTRVAFVVHNSENEPIGIMWIMFKAIHEIAWWERRYIGGLANSLGKILATQSLDLAVNSFQHKVPVQVKCATDSISTLIYLISSSGVPESKEWISRLEEINTPLLTVLWQTCEVRTLLSRSRGLTGSAFPTRPLEEFVNRAISLVTESSPSPDAWEIKYDPPEIKTLLVDGVFYPAIYNLLANAATHGWATVAKSMELACIWLRKESGNIYVIVADNGDSPEEDPILNSRKPRIGSQATSGSRKGLVLVQALLKCFGGNIVYYQKKDFLNKYGKLPNKPVKMDLCNTFFEFCVPV